MSYVLGIDQSTQGTKAIIIDGEGKLLGRCDRKHKQWVNEQGWVSHDLDEIYRNVIGVVGDVIEKTGIDAGDIVAVGISNQRETTCAWHRDGRSAGKAIVWQCSRAKDITAELSDYADEVYQRTGLNLSPYFPAAKMAWILRHQADEDDVLLGTIDAWLTYRLTGGKAFKTDYSNASRTQLFNLHTLAWDTNLCELFGVDSARLPEVVYSDSVFGMTDFEGTLPHPVPICGVLGDSHAALFGQGCHTPGSIKATYGTGSSIMMNIGDAWRQSAHGLVTSLAWGIGGKVEYVFEGNINYTGAVISWLQNDVKLFDDMDDLEKSVAAANQADTSYLVPAFSGLGAPHWKDDAKAALSGMTRTTGRDEILKAGLESIAYQVNDVLAAMRQDAPVAVTALRVDGGPTKNAYLMQFQSDISEVEVDVPEREELSALGAAYCAGISCGALDKDAVFAAAPTARYAPAMDPALRASKIAGWNHAVSLTY